MSRIDSYRPSSDEGYREPEPYRPTVLLPRPGQGTERERQAVLRGADGRQIASVPCQEGAAILIGRDSQAGIRLADPHLSRRHAVIEWDAWLETHVITDCGSDNGTFVDDVAVRSPIRLDSGARIRLGATTVFYERPEGPLVGRQLTIQDGVPADDIDSVTTPAPSSAEVGAEDIDQLPTNRPSTRQPAWDVDVSEQARSAVMRQDEVDAGRTRGGELTTAEQEELRRLREQVKILQHERDILKRAAALFAKEAS